MPRGHYSAPTPFLAEPKYVRERDTDNLSKVEPTAKVGKQAGAPAVHGNVQFFLLMEEPGTLQSLSLEMSKFILPAPNAALL
eukprot:481473-Amphidinium_carterae.1